MTSTEVRIGHVRVNGYTDLEVLSSANDVSGLVQDVTAATDLDTNLAGYAYELIAVDLTISGSPEPAGTGFTRATVDTSGVSGSTDLQLRLPATLWDSYPLAAGCSLRVEGTPLWPFDEVAQISAWETDELLDVSCP